MKPLKGTKTAENLLKAFAGESQAKNRYTFYAEKAREEGYEQIADYFMETAKNEEAHACRFYGFLAEEFKGDCIEIEAGYPVGLGTTADNLGYAAAGEYEEWSDLYPSFAETADAEGFANVAACFRMVAKAEVNHETRFKKLKANVEEMKVFDRDTEETYWICGRCGYIHKGKTAPQKCPTCLYPQSYFSLFVEDY